MAGKHGRMEGRSVIFLHTAMLLQADAVADSAMCRWASPFSPVGSVTAAFSSSTA